MPDEQLAVLTIDRLIAATQKRIPLFDGELLVRKISSPEYLATFPTAPSVAETWPEEDYAKHERAWLEGLAASDPEAFAARVQKNVDRYARVLAMAALDPKLTFEQAKALGNDGVAAATEILVFSGILKPAEPAPEG